MNCQHARRDQNALICATNRCGDRHDALGCCDRNPLSAEALAVRYLPPFDVIKSEVSTSSVQGELRVSMSYDAFLKIIKMFAATLDVDEPWYLRHYDDIARVVRDGRLPSGRQHFVDDGYFEGRLPFPIRVDEQWYLAQNPDVAEDVRKGVIASGQAHFDEFGYREGRLPFPL
jgi:hypothetical protein